MTNNNNIENSYYINSAGEECLFKCPKCGNKSYDNVSRPWEGKSFYLVVYYFCTQCKTRFEDPEAFINGTDTYEDEN